jgi:hypothetical protein
MRKSGLMTAAIMAGMLAAQTAAAATGPILSLNLFSRDSTGNCADTIGGSGCSPLGVTLAGSLSNPFLNNLGDKSISLASGSSYYLFGNPWAGTSFMTEGAPISLFLTLPGDLPGSSRLLIDNDTVPDLSVAGLTLFEFAAYGIKITTTGITDADRMSFGYPPGAFAADGRADFVLRLDYGVTAPPEPPTVVPEPAAWAMMIAGFGLAGAVLRRRGTLVSA